MSGGGAAGANTVVLPKSVDPEQKKIVATRGKKDNPILTKLLNMKVQKYFPGYGMYMGTITSMDSGRSVVSIDYEDGDSEEMYLDQVVEYLRDDAHSSSDAVLSSAILSSEKDEEMIEKCREKYGTVWPPPAISARFAVLGQRSRKPSALCLQALDQMDFAMPRSRGSKKQGTVQKQKKETPAEPHLVSPASTRSLSLNNKSNSPRSSFTTTKSPRSSSSNSSLSISPKKSASHSKPKPSSPSSRKESALRRKNLDEVSHTSDALNSSVSNWEDELDLDFCESRIQNKHPNSELPKSQSTPKRRKRSFSPTLSSSHEPIAPVVKILPRLWMKCSRCSLKHWNDADCTLDVLKLVSSKQSASSPGPKRWSGDNTTLMTSKLKEGLLSSTQSLPSVSNDSPPPQLSSPLLCKGSTPPPLRQNLDGSDLASSTLPCTGNEELITDESLLSSRSLSIQSRSPSLNSSCAVGDEERPIDQDEENDCSFSGPTFDEKALIRKIYTLVNSQEDIMCGAAGYGMTGYATRGSMSKLINKLRSEFGLGPDAHFMDLGSGMGRPTLHVASLTPGVASSFGTEFNPALYKQSMLVLRECYNQLDMFKKNPRTFFMDANIRDFHSLEPFTHVFCFNLGFPDDLVEYVIKLLRDTASVQYAMLFAHRNLTPKRMTAVIGEIVYTQSMQVPGGNFYALYVVRVRHDNGHEQDNDPTNGDETSRTWVSSPDAHVAHALEIIRSPELYCAYVEQLGTAPQLDSEQSMYKSTRSTRKLLAETQFLSLSPCIPDIDIGFLRHVALKLGIPSSGSKIDVLARIKHYVPETFQLSLFAVGSEVDEACVNLLVTHLLSKQPSRRQPEAT